MGICFLQTRSGAIWSGGACRGDWVAETPVLRRGFAGGYGFQGAVGHFGLLLVCRFFASFRMTAKVVAQNDNGDCPVLPAMTYQAGNDTSGWQ